MLTTRVRFALVLGCGLLFCTLPAIAQTPSADETEILERLRRLEERQQEFERLLEERDARIRELEAELARGRTDEPESEPVEVAVTEPGDEAVAEGDEADEDETGSWGRYEPGKGFILASTKHGEVSWSLFTYARYLNQNFDDTYTDSFGRTFLIDERNDVQLNKVNISFKGWLFDPKFRFLVYSWSANTSQGDPAQVVLAGNMGYQFSEKFNLYAGIGGLPSTRSVNYTFPNWLKNDHRSIADEYFRGSYTSGIWVNGTLARGLKYRSMLGNNLSQLGVNAAQLDGSFNTWSSALWWMPTTGEYGPGEGLGDFEFHEDFATLFGIHYTQSTEDRQSQPGTEDFENSQIRLSDGTRIFSPDPWMTGGNVFKVDYKMVAINGGFKYRGWSLEAEAYFRHLDDFRVTGTIPVDEITDHGFQVQGSFMVLPSKLQAFLEYSKIYGDYGDPWDSTLGMYWFPFDRKEFRLQVQGLYLKDSPVGYSSVPFSVGANGWAYTLDGIIAF